MSVSKVLGYIRRSSTSERVKGDGFEWLILVAFRVDRTYQERFTGVWLWMGWPDGGNEPDMGIDLFARHVGGVCSAIQCKFYTPDHTLAKADIDSFFTASRRERRAPGKLTPIEYETSPKATYPPVLTNQAVYAA